MARESNPVFRVPDCDHQALDIQGAAVQIEPKIERHQNTQQRELITGHCPICKVNLSNWHDLKEHVKFCRKEHQHPLLMRACYCPYCLMKLSDAYSLSSHIQSSHSSHIHNMIDLITENFGSPQIIETRGMRMEAMPEPFPFACSSCHKCWPSVKGLADHFVGMEKRNRSCGGHLSVYVKPCTRRLTTMNDELACDRYDFASPVVCPFCPKGFEEAYALDAHIRKVHAKLQAEKEKQFAPQVAKYPVKKLYYLPFLCSKCRSTFKTMKEYAQHYHDRTMIGNPCNGDLKIMKLTEESGQARKFTSNMPPPPSRNDDNDVAESEPEPRGPSAPTAARAEERGQPGEEQPGTSQRKIKDEPMDPDEPQITDTIEMNEPWRRAHHEAHPQDPSGSTEEASTAAAAAGRAVVKDEPMDDYEESAVDAAHSVVPSTAAATSFATSVAATVKEEPMDEDQPGPSHQCDKAEVKEEIYEDCEECGIQFTSEAKFIEHMKEHGYELAVDLEEDQIANLEAGRDMGPPSAKKHRVEEQLMRPRFPPLIGHLNPQDSWFQCSDCEEVCLTLAEYREHTKCHSKRFVASHECYVCKRKLDSLEKKIEHEKRCPAIMGQKARARSLECFVGCPFCGKRQHNAFVMGAHMEREHWDTLLKLRKYYLMASEFLLFRCTKCHVGFEDPRTLLNHFRLREEYGIPCYGMLHVHAYMQSLHDFFEREKKASDDLCYLDSMAPLPYPPSIKEEECDEDDDNWCPRDPAPSDEIDLNGLIKCMHCNEYWPRAQIKLHEKMEHPKLYFESAPYKCKRCKAYGFYCVNKYAEHYESCTNPSEPGIHCDKETDCAPQQMTPFFRHGERGKLPAIPEEMGNEMRECRFCKQPFSPEGLLWHQKNEHPVQHFTDAPYNCPKCGDVGFYKHTEYKEHAKTCTGEMPIHLEKSIFAITAREVERRAVVNRVEVPSYRNLIEVDRRKYGTLAAFHRPVKCAMCNKWCSSLLTYAEHKADAHPNMNANGYSYLCGGCGLVFKRAEDLKKHLEMQNEEGNMQCYDMAMLNETGCHNTFARAPVQLVYRAPALPPRSGMGMHGRPAFANPTLGYRPPPRVFETGYDDNNDYKNLARREAAERRTNQLLPIRPLNIMSKSPLSGERFAHVTQSRRIVSSPNAPPDVQLQQTQAFYKQVTANQRQKALTKVDMGAPLLPRRYNIGDEEESTSSRMDTQFQPPSTSTPSVSRHRLSSTLPSSSVVRPPILTSSRPFIGLHASPHRLAPSRPSGSAHPDTTRPAPAFNPHRPFVRAPSKLLTQPTGPMPMSQMPCLTPAVPQVTQGQKVPKAEPKQEPL